MVSLPRPTSAAAAFWMCATRDFHRQLAMRAAGPIPPWCAATTAGMERIRLPIGMSCLVVLHRFRHIHSLLPAHGRSNRPNAVMSRLSRPPSPVSPVTSVSPIVSRLVSRFDMSQHASGSHAVARLRGDMDHAANRGRNLDSIFMASSTTTGVPRRLQRRYRPASAPPCQ